MRRTLFTVRGLHVPSYPAMFYLGVSIGMVVQNAAAHAAGLPAGRVYAATLVLLPIALIGARLLHVTGHWRGYLGDPRRILDRASGGMALYGGLIVMLPASVAVLDGLRVPYWRFWDVTSFLILVAMITTRFGCLLNGCCTGRVTSGRFGFSLSDTSGERARRIPTQLLEAAVAGILLAAAAAAAPFLHRPGELFLVVLLGYTACRVALQPLRAERARVDVTLLLSVLLVALSLVGLVLLRT